MIELQDAGVAMPDRQQFSQFTRFQSPSAKAEPEQRISGRFAALRAFVFRPCDRNFDLYGLGEGAEIALATGNAFFQRGQNSLGAGEIVHAVRSASR